MRLLTSVETIEFCRLLAADCYPWGSSLPYGGVCVAKDLKIVLS